MYKYNYIAVQWLVKCWYLFQTWQQLNWFSMHGYKRTDTVESIHSISCIFRPYIDSIYTIQLTLGYYSEGVCFVVPNTRCLYPVHLAFMESVLFILSCTKYRPTIFIMHVYLVVYVHVHVYFSYFSYPSTWFCTQSCYTSWLATTCHSRITYMWRYVMWLIATDHLVNLPIARHKTVRSDIKMLVSLLN